MKEDLARIWVEKFQWHKNLEDENNREQCRQSFMAGYEAHEKEFSSLIDGIEALANESLEDEYIELIFIKAKLNEFVHIYRNRMKNDN